MELCTELGDLADALSYWLKCMITSGSTVALIESYFRSLFSVIHSNGIFEGLR